MSTQGPRPGTAGWIDLTTDDAPRVRDFYAAVVGWKPEAVAMGEYADWNMGDPVSGEARAGVCHRRGANAGQPGGWIVYFVVSDLDASVAECVARGGKVRSERRASGFVVIEDPSGAVCALYQS